MTTRRAVRGLPSLLLFAAALAAPGAAGAAEGDSADAAVAARYRALRLEQVLGDLEGAADAWARAAAAADPELRAEARLRGAAVLERLGRMEDAREMLRALVADPAPPPGPRIEEARRRLEALTRAAAPGTRVDSPEVAALREERLALEEEARGLRRRLDEALRTTADVEDLRMEIRTRDADLADLRARLLRAERADRAAAGAATPGEIEEDRRRDREQAVYLSAEYARLGRDFHAAGRFEDARRLLREAVDLDPGNERARELLERATAPLPEREGLARGILELLALEHSLLVEQVRGEAEELLRAGRDAVAAGRAAEGADRFEAALRRLDARPAALDALDGLRGDLARRFEEASRAAGTPRAAPERPAGAGGDARLPEALRQILESAGAAGETGGAALRVFPLAPVAAAQAAALPPSPAPHRRPAGLVVLPDVPPAAGAFRAAIRGAVEPEAWRAPGAVLECVGGSLVARAGPRALAALEATMDASGRPPLRSVPLEILVVPCAPEALAAALRDAGARFSGMEPGSGAVAVDAGAVAVLTALAGPAGPSLSAAVRAAERRGAVVATLPPEGGAGPPEECAGLRVEAVAWWLGPGRLAAGAVVSAAVEAVPGVSAALGRATLSRSRAAGGGDVRPGGALVFPGVPIPGAEPGSPPRHGAVLVVVGDVAAPVPAAVAGEGAATPVDLGDLPRRGVDAAGPLAPAGEDGVAARIEALRAWLQMRAPGGTRVRLAGTGLAVEGGPAAAAVVVEDLGRLAADGTPVPLLVRVHSLGPAAEAALLRDLPLLSPSGEGDLRFAVLQGRVRDRVRFLLAGDAEGAPAGAPVAALAQAAQRAVFARVEELGAGGRPARRGVEVGVRPWPGDLPDERWIWADVTLLLAGEAGPRREPPVMTAIRRNASLLLVGLRSPFGDPARTRLVVLVEWGS